MVRHCKLRFEAQLPDGQIGCVIYRPRVQPLLEKDSDFQKCQISLQPFPFRPTEGRVAIVTNAGWNAVDVDAPITNGVDADGEVVWS